MKRVVWLELDADAPTELRIASYPPLESVILVQSLMCVSAQSPGTPVPSKPGIKIAPLNKPAGPMRWGNAETGNREERTFHLEQSSRKAIRSHIDSRRRKTHPKQTTRGA